MKDFPIGVVLSITTGRLCCDMDDVYKILNYLTGDNLFTHQLPRASRECKPWILRRHPELVNVDVSMFDSWPAEGMRFQVAAWVEEQAFRFGSTIMLDPIPQDEHCKIDPVAEAEQMIGKDKVVVVSTDKLP